MWYKEDPNGYTWNELITLYQIVDKREMGFREDLYRFTHFYSAVCYAILAVTLSGFVTLYTKGQAGLILMTLLMGPFLTLCMCILGIRVTSHIYKRILKEISVKAKLENALGLDNKIPINKFMGKSPIWTEDESFLSKRHAEKRLKDSNSDAFVNSLRKSGFHRNNRAYFGIIAIFSLILSILIILSSLHSAKII